MSRRRQWWCVKAKLGQDLPTKCLGREVDHLICKPLKGAQSSPSASPSPAVITAPTAPTATPEPTPEPEPGSYVELGCVEDYRQNRVGAI